MIEREYAVVCDICGTRVAGFDSFDAAKNFAQGRDGDWCTLWIGERAINVCDECRKDNDLVSEAAIKKVKHYA